MQLRKDELTWHAAGDEVVILDLDGSVYLKLNGSGRALWELLSQGATETELVTALTDRYAIAPELAATDVGRFLDSLRQRNLIEDE
ncbi:PqqD family protein [Ilumatobacter nonamiensis]|uniref:PqqD family protein n=1 Tax=Ilumatobacter nonamiensis TaxID=467093 RepID=UPI00058C70FC|nr:PqqD family protein [Ilumatobacter nonamiensis]